jgi:hypothetical protein
MRKPVCFECLCSQFYFVSTVFSACLNEIPSLHERALSPWVDPDNVYYSHADATSSGSNSNRSNNNLTSQGTFAITFGLAALIMTLCLPAARLAASLIALRLASAFANCCPPCGNRYCTTSLGV